jgi:hypothetical protein
MAKPNETPADEPRLMARTARHHLVDVSHKPPPIAVADVVTDSDAVRVFIGPTFTRKFRSPACCGRAQRSSTGRVCNDRSRTWGRGPAIVAR